MYMKKSNSCDDYDITDKSTGETNIKTKKSQKTSKSTSIKK
ncbi:hypothetical protein BH23THE1_BH23THE1_09370 [soil metagenome]